MPRVVYESKEPELFVKVEKIQTLSALPSNIQFWEQRISEYERHQLEAQEEAKSQRRRAADSRDPARYGIAQMYDDGVERSRSGKALAERKVNELQELERQLTTETSDLSQQQRDEYMTYELISTKKEDEMRAAEERQRKQEEKARKAQQFEAFKVAYFAEYDSRFFKNPFSKMRTKLLSGEIKTMDDVENHLKDNPSSMRTQAVYKKLGL